jgi:hypothetical protein
VRRVFGIEYEGIMDKGYPPFRHSLSLVLDPQADRIHKVSLAAPANEWGRHGRDGIGDALHLPAGQ